MENVDSFFEKYKIEAFYEDQKKWSDNPIKPFDKNMHKKLSHKLIPGFRNYDLFYERYKSAAEILKANQKLQDGMSILDIGCGEGFFKIFIDQINQKQLNWFGIEIWKERREFCKHLGYAVKDVNLENGIIPFEENQFDVVIASHVIEHIPNPDQIIKEMGRVTKNDGTIIIATPTKIPIVAKLDSKYHEIMDRKVGETQQAFTHRTLEKLVLKSLALNEQNILDKRGFRILSGRKHLPIENWKWFYQLSQKLGKKLMYFVPEINLIIENQK